MWAKDNTANNVYSCSIAERIQSSDIYVNDDTDVETVFFWHYCGFGYISGKPSDTGSMNTALKCGFIQNKINTVIRKKGL